MRADGACAVPVTDTLFAAETALSGHTARATADGKAKMPEQSRLKRTGSWLKRFFRNFDDYDTSYIQPNYYNYTAMLQNTNFSQLYRMKGENADRYSQTLHMEPSPSLKIGPYFGWRWLFLGYTFDVLHPRSAVKATELNLSLYSSMLGVDLVYIRNTGDFTLKRVRGFSDAVAQAVKGRRFDGMDAYTASVNLYYVFNHRHFSYPAAYAQSTVQRKSCGSWVLGLNYSRQRINFDYTRLPEELLSPLPGDVTSQPLLDELKISRVDYTGYSVSVGYAYNWVFARNWLLSASFTPAFGIKRASGERITGDAIWLNMKNFNFDFISRAGIVWNNSHWFAGVSFISHLYDYQKGGYTLSNSINYLNVYFGLMFGRKRQYRNR